MLRFIKTARMLCKTSCQNGKKREEKGSLGRFWTKVEKKDKNGQKWTKVPKTYPNRTKVEKTGKNRKKCPILDRAS